MLAGAPHRLAVDGGLRKLMAGPADTRYLYGSIVATGKVKANAQIALGHDVPSVGISLGRHTHTLPPAGLPAPVPGE